MRKQGGLPRAARNNDKSRFKTKKAIFTGVAHRAWIAMGVYSLFFGVV